MASPNLLSTAKLQDPSVVFDGIGTTGHDGLSGLKSAFKPRAYQLEMLEESMRRNIIVAVRLSWLPVLRRLTHLDGHWFRKDTNVFTSTLWHDHMLTQI